MLTVRCRFVNASTHRQIAGFIWDICNLLRGVYKRNEYRKVILPLTVLRRFDCVLAPTKQAVLDEHARSDGQIDTVKHQLLQNAAQRPFYNTSKLDFRRLTAASPTARPETSPTKTPSPRRFNALGCFDGALPSQAAGREGGSQQCDTFAPPDPRRLP